MLFRDDSCLSSRETLQRQFQQGIPQLLGSDWFAIMTLTAGKRARVEASISLDGSGDEHALSFVAGHAQALFEQNYKSRVFSMDQWEYIVFPIRVTEKGHRVFTLHGRKSGRYDPRDIQWYTIFAEAAFGRVLLQNQYIQEVNYVNSILDSTSDLIMVLDESYSIISQNDASKKFWGDSPGFADTIHARVKGPEQLLEAIESTRRDGTMHQMNNVVVTAGADNHILNLNISPLCNSKSQIPGVVLVGSDVTQHQLFEHQLEYFKYYGLLGEISLGLSHDIKNPLMNISNCTTLLKKERSFSEKSQQLVGFISSEVQRIDGIVNQMLSFGNVTRQNECTQLNVNSVLRNCIQMVHRQKIFRDIEIRSKLDTQLPPIRAKNTDMQQIFLNVLSNALQAIQDDGIIWVESSYAPETGRIQISIADNGMGLQSADSGKLFSPYYTTKDHGTGLGLFIVRHSLSHYGGTISLETDQAGLTVCRITLPVSQQA